MPSARFNQLKQVKKRTFLRKAYQEFSLHSYEGASITRLVANLKMAKGSIYQYFEDKEDLYNFLVAHTDSQLHSLLKQTCPLPVSSNSFHSWYKNFVLVQLKFFLSLPSSGLLLLRNQNDQMDSKARDTKPLAYTYLSKAVEKAGHTLSNEKVYQLFLLPLIIFRYILDMQDESLTDLVESEKNINIPSKKLLNLCDRFIE